MMMSLLCAVLLLTIGERRGYYSFFYRGISIRSTSLIANHDDVTCRSRSCIVLQYSNNRNGADAVSTTTDSPADIILRLRRKSDKKSFLSYLKFISSHVSISSAFSSEEKKAIASEVDFRVGSLDLLTMAECLCCLGRLGMRHSCCEEVRVVTAEVFLSFQYASTLHNAAHHNISRASTASSSSSSSSSVPLSSVGNGVTLRSINALLQGLLSISIPHQRGVFYSQPQGMQQLLLEHIGHILLHHRQERYSDLNELLSLLGKLSVRYRKTSPLFQRSLVVFLSTLRREDVPVQAVSRLFYHLAKLEINWTADLLIAGDAGSDRGGGVHSNLLGLVLAHKGAFQHMEVVSIVYALGKMSMDWSSNSSGAPALYEELQSALYEELQRVSSEMTGVSLSNVFWSLGRMGVRWSSDVPTDLSIKLLQQLLRCSPLLPQSLSNTLLGFQKLKLDWSLLPPGLRASLLSTVTLSSSSSSSCDPITEQCVANIVWSLGSMGACRDSLPDTVWDGLFSSIVRVSPSFTQQGLVSCMIGLSKLGFEYRELPDSATRAMEKAACAGGPAGLLSAVTRDVASAALCEGVVSNFVHSLGSMDALWFSADRDRDRDNISRDVDVDRRKMLSHQLCIEVCKAIEVHAPSMNEQAISNTLFGLAKLSVRWDALPSSTREALWSRLQSMLSGGTFNQLDLMNSFWAMSIMTTSDRFSIISSEAVATAEGKKAIAVDPHPHPPLQLTAIFLPDIIRLSSHFTAVTLATVYYSLSKLGYSYRSSSSSSQLQHHQAILSSLEARFTAPDVQPSGSEVAGIIYSLGRMQCSFYSHQLTPSMQSKLLRTTAEVMPDMTEQELGNSVWGLGQMGVYYPTMPISLRTSLEDALGREHMQLRKQALVAILQGLGKGFNETTAPWYSLPQGLRRVMVDNIRRLSPTLRDASPVLSVGHSVLVGNILLALGHLKVSWLDDEIADLLNTHLLPHLLQSNGSSGPIYDDGGDAADRDRGRYASQSATAAVNGVARMSSALEWTDIPLMVRTFVLDMISRHVGSMTTPSELSTLLWSLAKLGMKKLLLPPETKQQLLLPLMELAGRMTGHELVWCIWSLGRMDLLYADLPSELQKELISSCMESRAIESMSGEEFGLMLWSLAKVQVPIDDMPAAMKEALLYGIDNLTGTTKQKRVAIGSR